MPNKVPPSTPRSESQESDLEASSRENTHLLHKDVRKASVPTAPLPLPLCVSPYSPTPVPRHDYKQWGAG